MQGELRTKREVGPAWKSDTSVPSRARLPQVVSKATPSVVGLRDTAILPDQRTALAATLGRCAGWSSERCGRSRKTTSSAPKTTDRPGQRGRAGIARWQIIGDAVQADGLNASPLANSDEHQPQLDFAANMQQQDHLGGMQCQPRRWQTENGAFADESCLHKGTTVAAFSLLGRDRHLEAF